MTSLAESNKQSPFDSIRKYRADGSEFWSARELMAILQYVKWQKFKDVIDIAKENLETIDTQASNHFLPVEVKSLGRNAIDFELSRLACYHIALASDSRGKDAVKMAKHYFAVKTREAEVIIPAQNDELEMMRLRVQLAEAERDAAIAQKNLLDKREAVLSFHATTPAALILGATVVTDKTPVERVIDNASGRVFEGVGITAIAKKLGFKNTKDCWQWLESIGYGKDSEYWDLQLSAVEHHKLRPDAYDEILNKWNQGIRQRFIGE